MDSITRAMGELLEALKDQAREGGTDPEENLFMSLLIVDTNLTACNQYWFWT